MGEISQDKTLANECVNKAKTGVNAAWESFSGSLGEQVKADRCMPAVLRQQR